MTETLPAQVKASPLSHVAQRGQKILAEDARQLGPATGKTDRDLERASAHVASVPASTLRLYQLGQRTFAEWCQSEGIPYDFPAHAVTPEALACFVGHLAREGKSPATVNAYVSGVARMHRQIGIASPADSQVVKDAKAAHRKAKGARQRQAAPMRRGMVDAALASLSGSPLALRNRALIALAYDSMCRASELVALNVSDLVETDRGAVVFIASSKTDQDAQGDYGFVSPQTFAFLKEWIDAARLDPEAPLFVPLSAKAQGERLTRRDVARIFKAHVGESLSAHSARVGAAVDQRAAGLSTGDIARSGRWRGEAMPHAYTRHLDPHESGAAKLARMQGRA